MMRPRRRTEAAKINVQNRQRRLDIDTSKLQTFAEKALIRVLTYSRKRRTPLRELREISVLLISDWRMSGLHRDFLNREGTTDVISFEHGEICISVETARRHARQFGTSTFREIELYIIHGLLHLNGFDDQTRRDAAKMGRVQQKILRMVSED
jgi:probable rRNA maturation factor